MGTVLLAPSAILIVFLQSLLLCIMMPIFAGEKCRIVSYRAAAVVVTAGALCCLIAKELSDYDDYVTVRAMIPYVSLAERLPQRPAPSGQLLTPHSNESLSKVEGRLNFRGWRASEIKRIHESATWEFINRPGFGSVRMGPRSVFDVIDWKCPVIPQPNSPPQYGSTSEQEVLKDKTLDTNKLEEFHQNSLVDFVNSQGFGYVKDRRQVAGFDSHGFSKIPEPSKPLQLISLELVGILRDNPVVYVSDYLPLMSELRQAPTRSLDAFENSGLKSLRRGEDLIVKQSETSLRVLGAIRSTKQCINCHGGERGDLLGAFSYILR